MAGGGTGGHLFPALAIADEIRKLSPESKFLFVGTKGKIEERVVPQRDYPFRRIWISGFHRRLTLGNMLFPAKLVVSLVQSFFLIKQFQPDVVVGTGSYVCGPILLVASWLGIPTVVHESNSYPGFTTRLVASNVSRVFIAYEATKQWLKRTDHVELVGTPTREVLGTVSKDDGRKFFVLDSQLRTVLIFGGSLGATSINNAMLTMIDELVRTGIQMIWQTGQVDLERVQEAVRGKKVGWVGPFIEKMEYAYAAADVVVCRSGALTIAELTRVGLPAIVVPYPHAAADHQTQNARTLVDAGAALMVKDAEIQQHLKTELVALLADERRRNGMALASKRLGKPEAGKLIAQKTLELIH
jgi:UDP-N-acetylglucosamine--N-acetylmuramyl-(pentapeptide) pyrophosphoryl-undecaprenol N-acetylglucosamine transferase